MTDPLFGWAVWEPAGNLSSVVLAEGLTAYPDNVWETIGPVIGWDSAVAKMRHDLGWRADSLDEQDCELLSTHEGFKTPGSRGEFLTERDAARARETSGEPHPAAWAAWAPNGALMAAGHNVRGLSGWHSLGIGHSAEGCILDQITEEELAYLNRNIGIYHVPGGRGVFLQRAQAAKDSPLRPGPQAAYAVWNRNGSLRAVERMPNPATVTTLYVTGGPVDLLDPDEYEHIATVGNFYLPPGGRELFLAWRHAVSDSTTATPAPTVSALGRAFTEALIAHGPGHEDEMPENVRAQFLVGCLSALDAAVADWAEQGS